MITSLLLALLVSAEVRTVSTYGEGEVKAQPDIVSVQLGITTESTDAKEALKTSSQKMSKVVQQLKSMGLSGDDIQTAQFQIYPHQPYRRDGQPGTLKFRVTNQVSVTTTNIAMTGDILAKAVQAGANSVQHVRFDVKDASKHLDVARRRAVADARRKAQLFANASASKLGRVLEVVEEGASAPEGFGLRGMKAAAAESVPMEPGQNSLRIQVNVSWELLDR